MTSLGGTSSPSFKFPRKEYVLKEGTAAAAAATIVMRKKKEERSIADGFSRVRDEGLRPSMPSCCAWYSCQWNQIFERLEEQDSRASL